MLRVVKENEEGPRFLLRHERTRQLKLSSRWSKINCLTSSNALLPLSLHLFPPLRTIRSIYCGEAGLNSEDLGQK